MSQSLPDDAEAARELARRVGQTMYANDQASQSLGIRIEEIGPGYARMSM